tara:strand:+ start:303 stop:458 length:156 start_codon:yes stop_codon:yes gene_type:complete
LVCPPNDFLLGDFNVHVWVDGLDEDGISIGQIVVVEFSGDFISLEAIEGIL